MTVLSSRRIERRKQSHDCFKALFARRVAWQTSSLARFVLVDCGRWNYRCNYIHRINEINQSRRFRGAWLDKPRVSQGPYLWTVVDGIPTSRAVCTERCLAKLSAAFE
ncbi:hypothetical protein AVEN_269932-1 [Araneus ventricosus]|uniref:Uncharacterized protein n=1 Tax=Araneus ventricosus TaxID=182803 RepID=A0A4Y2NL91_ARAVE|nr:hypothetical protein AVEN_269932-1 [Araneus ventricosus]